MDKSIEIKNINLGWETLTTKIYEQKNERATRTY